MTQRTETSGLTPAETALEEQRGGKSRTAFLVNCVRASGTRHMTVMDRVLQLLRRQSPVEMGDGKRVERDLRLDFIRGVSLIWIFIDHIRGNFFEAITLQRFSFMDAAEILFSSRAT